MIQVKTADFGIVDIFFFHHLPNVEVPNCHNNLIGMLRNLKISRGYTDCELVFHNEELPSCAWGKAYTHPNDQYDKERGRELSLRRAIQAAGMSDQGLRQVLSGYYSR
jgi:hypothetical protein